MQSRSHNEVWGEYDSQQWSKAYPLFLFNPSKTGTQSFNVSIQKSHFLRARIHAGCTSDLPFYLQIKMTLIPVGARLSSLNETGIKIQSATVQWNTISYLTSIWREALMLRWIRLMHHFFNALVRHLNKFITFLGSCYFKIHPDSIVSRNSRKVCILRPAFREVMHTYVYWATSTAVTYIFMGFTALK